MINKELLVKSFRIKVLGERRYDDTHKHEKYTHCTLRLEEGEAADANQYREPSVHPAAWLLKDGLV